MVVDQPSGSTHTHTHTHTHPSWVIVLCFRRCWLSICSSQCVSQQTVWNQIWGSCVKHTSKKTPNVKAEALYKAKYKHSPSSPVTSNEILKNLMKKNLFFARIITVANMTCALYTWFAKKHTFYSHFHSCKLKHDLMCVLWSSLNQTYRKKNTEMQI